MKNKKIVPAAVALILLGGLSVSFYQQKYPKLMAPTDESEAEGQHADEADEANEASGNSGMPSSQSMNPASFASMSFAEMSEAMAGKDPQFIQKLSQAGNHFSATYGDSEWSLLHIASYQCSAKMVKLLHTKGKLNWNLLAKDGTTPLTLAAENNCLPVLMYWKEQQASFHKKDGRGKSAMQILKQQDKNAELLAFINKLEGNKGTTEVAKAAPFYRKRQFPSAVPGDNSRYAAESNIRPDEMVDTADFSEFAD